eukprot:CAMPEP_0183299942 /NCGR_PEP_ID=MMETSP0160_2-20130417/6520_1 /TAXON_ID=2839 ORGANISM="Odontella Sinensis, Strain Grunow 1884" /NCGR_SAMPLE_ID=MMETSP0160_2 /ASSEMBLY_ACC=CAM_ASM_000250 /LENGTH=69 /DNA_ID=CAMNT_0025462271 /DNA_START=70 /DNA_END=279 /DNA_ORIENTATION=-
MSSSSVLTPFPTPILASSTILPHLSSTSWTEVLGTVLEYTQAMVANMGNVHTLTSLETTSSEIHFVKRR